MVDFFANTEFVNKSACKIIGNSDRFSQSIFINGIVLEHLQKFQQLNCNSFEAGGQLFGFITKEDVFICDYSGPFVGDERGRYLYRSNPKKAQNAISNKIKLGLLYLGEWHTHAENIPNPSELDGLAMKKIFINSKLNTNILLMLIIGKNPIVDGLCLVSSNGTELIKWDLKCID